MSENKIVLEILDYIEYHLDEDLSLEKIAKECNYSKFHLARLFAEQTKCTIYQYIKGRRLTLAAKQLIETQLPIIEIAYEAHYNSQQAFTLAFQQLYRCTPQVYRRGREFYPGQSRIRMSSSFLCCIYSGHLVNGRRAA